MKGTAFLALAAGMTVATTTGVLAQCDDGETVIRFSHVSADTDHPKGDAARALAARVNAEMDGSACMEVYPASELYDDEEVMEALLAGDVQLAAPSLSKLEAYTLKYRLFDLPFLFEDLAAVERFTAGDVGRDLLHAMDDDGFAGLAFWTGGLKQFSANRPLLAPADADGLSFRVQASDVAVAMIEAIGGTAVPLVFSEAIEAINTGAVDGQENSWSNIYTQRFFEVQDGVTETNHQALAWLLVTSADWLAGLDADVRDRFLAIVDEVTTDEIASVAATEAANRRNILDAGGAIRELTDTQRQAWVGAMAPVWDQFRDDIGDALIAAAVAAND